MTNDIQVPPYGPFPDDQDPDKPFYVNKTLGAMSKIKSTYKDGRWLYAKNMTDEEIRTFYKAPEDAPVERQDETVAVWVSTKHKEPKFPAFDEPIATDATTVQAFVDARGFLETVTKQVDDGFGKVAEKMLADKVAAASRAETQPAPSEPESETDSVEYWRERAKRAEKGMMEEMRIRLQARESPGCACGVPAQPGITHSAKSCVPTHWNEPKPRPAPLPVPIPPYVPSRDIEGTLRTCGMKLFELIENVEKTHKDEAHRMLILSNEIHAMASRFELGKLRAGMKRR